MRLIDADANGLYDKTYYPQDWSGIQEYPLMIEWSDIKNAPTIDAVPVVRCKDCKHSATDWTTGRFLCARNGKVVGDEVWGGFAVDKNGYCSFGEKRDLEG